MALGRINAADFIARLLPQPHERDLGVGPAHHLLATVHTDIACPPSGHSIGWSDCYAAADMLLLPLKADLLLEPDDEPRPIPDHLTSEARERAEHTGRYAARIRREARRRGLR
ncbi:hypothetical protein [Streptomyces hirsutus]|uniref:hypothetical protein n=1 Tax=Streptomyces hirsutus TaxID=35620 RepID=UPI0006E1690D|nr:hypothetical protein [Streptomyces hirsutus]